MEDSSATHVNGDQSSNNATNSGATYVFVRSGTNWNQQTYLKAYNSGSGDEFGFSVPVSGAAVLAGAFGEDSSATGVNGNHTDNSTSNSGAAFVFLREGTNWVPKAYLKASNTTGNANFGQSVATAGDTMAVGAPGFSNSSGAVYIFTGLITEPRLSIEQSNRTVRISWPLPATSFVLEQTGMLTSPPIPWMQVPFPYETNDTHIFIRVPTPSATQFYRLRRP